MSVNISYNGKLHSYAVSPGMSVDSLMAAIRGRQKLTPFSLKLGDVQLLEMCPVRRYLVTRLTLHTDDEEVPVEINDLTGDVRIGNPGARRCLKLSLTIGQLKQKISATGFLRWHGNLVVKLDGQAVRDDAMLRSFVTKKTITVFQEMVKMAVPVPAGAVTATLMTFYPPVQKRPNLSRLNSLRISSEARQYSPGAGDRMNMLTKPNRKKAFCNYGEFLVEHRD